ncbi:MAG: beta-lactamase family protein [Hamadaea sp.]|nr:beta-lactamase family protein [Hamadaea sp.]
MSSHELAAFVGSTAKELDIAGVAVGVWADGREAYACHGVTSIANPLPVDRHTLFHISSVSKTFTATAMMRLVAQGRVDLDAPVCRYLPDLTLSDEDAATQITVLQLLNHTAGLDWNLITDLGDGDDALAAFVARLGELPRIAPPGVRASYSQAGYNLAGRIIEKVTGETYERAVTGLVLTPVGLTDTVFSLGDVITRRFAVGHNRGEDGRLSQVREWKAGGRADNPGGGIVSSAADLIRWARWHLGDGGAVLPTELLHRMREPSVALHASTLGDAVGICWLLRDIGGTLAAGHGGSGNGQFAELLLVPDRDFAVVSLANVGPEGIPFNQSVVRWALEHFLGVVDADPEPLPYDDARAQQVAGRYHNDAMNLTIAADGAALTLAVGIKPEIRAGSDTEMPPDYPPAAVGLLPDDEYIITEGGLRGQRGRFTRDAGGGIAGVDLAGRLFTRIPSA